MPALSIEGTTETNNQMPGRSFVRKINCGGPAAAGYEADLGSDDSSCLCARSRAPLDQRAMPIGAFYEDFALAHFGNAVAVEAGKILAAVDGAGSRPNPADWLTGPGDLKTDGTPLEQVKKRFEHVARFAALRGKVVGAGNLERFDYWSNTLKLNALMCEIAGIRGQLAAAVNKINAEKTSRRKAASCPGGTAHSYRPGTQVGGAHGLPDRHGQHARRTGHDRQS